MARYVFSKKDQVSGGRVAGAKTLAEGTGLFSMTPEEKHAASVKGGLTQGPIQGKKNAEPGGQLDETRALPQSIAARLTWATSEENKEACRKMGSLQGPKVDWSCVKTKQSCQKGAEIGGPIGRHVRWHVNRHVFNMACDLCLEAIARKENWGIEVFEPEN